MGALAVAVAAAMWATDPYFRPALTRQLTASQIVFVESLLDGAVFPPGGRARTARVASSPASSMDCHGHHRAQRAGVRDDAVHPGTRLCVPGACRPRFQLENEVLLYMLQPVFGIAMARIFLKERRKAYFWPLAACAIAGVYLIVFRRIRLPRSPRCSTGNSSPPS